MILFIYLTFDNILHHNYDIYLFLSSYVSHFSIFISVLVNNINQ